MKWDVNSTESCATECESVAECRVWTFVGNSSLCFLKSSRIEDIVSVEATSGECMLIEPEGEILFFIYSSYQ